MSSYTFSQKVFKLVPPTRGNFPIDHEEICKSTMIKYMRCLSENRGQSTLCCDLAKEYLACRMDNNLMLRDDWANLGFKETEKTKQT